MLTHDPDFVIADIKRARSELQAALIACDHVLAHDPETGARSLAVHAGTIAECAVLVSKFARSALTKRTEMLRQRRAAA